MKYDKNNIFAKIIRKEIPADIIYEDNQVLAFRDIAPAAPVHILVIPKKECVSYHDFIEKSSAEEIAYFFQSVQKICKDLNLQEAGYRIMCNIGKNAMQTVHHMHLHILSGKNLGRVNP